MSLSKEGFKTMLLSGLVVLSIALTQQLWVSIPVASIIPSSSKQMENIETLDNEHVNIANALSPQSFTISFGGEAHTVLFSDSHGIWEESLGILKNYFEDGVILEEISWEWWAEINDVRAIKLDFGYNMPTGVLKETVGGNNSGIFGKISSIDSVLMPVSENSVVYIFDKSNGKYYRVSGRVKNENIATIIDTIEGEVSTEVVSNFSQSKYDFYYPIKVLFDVNNDVLMPIDLSKNLSEMNVTQEIKPGRQEDYNQIEAFAGTFFGENFDFVKRIVEANDSIIYMYGYSQKVLRIDASGMIEYKEEFDAEKSGAPVDVEEATKIALNFVNRHSISPSHSVYLTNIKSSEKKKGYVFLFTYRMNGLPVYVEENSLQAPLEVEVVGKQVTYYKRLLRREQIDVSFLADMNQEDMAAPKKVLLENDKNFETLKKDLDIHAQNEDEAINQVLTAVKDIDLGYYDQTLGEVEKLIPVWKIQVDKKVYFFDVYTGDIVDQTRR